MIKIWIIWTLDFKIGLLNQSDNSVIPHGHVPYFEVLSENVRHLFMRFILLIWMTNFLIITNVSQKVGESRYMHSNLSWIHRKNKSLMKFDLKKYFCNTFNSSLGVQFKKLSGLSGWAIVVNPPNVGPTPIALDIF